MFFQEITLLDQNDISPHHVFSGIYREVHRALCNNVDENSLNIGISLPEYYYNKKKLVGNVGRKIRLFAKTKESLESLSIKTTLDTYLDYAHVGAIEEVGNKATHYEIYTRYRYKKPIKRAEKLRAHLIKTKGEQWYNDHFDNFDDVVAHCEKYGYKSKNLPFIRLVSTTNNQEYSVSFERVILQEPTEDFSFNDYGISYKGVNSSVPAW